MAGQLSSELDVAAAARVLGRPVRLVGRLAGGQHALTTAVSDGVAEYVVRRFPAGDGAAVREAAVLPRLAQLGSLVPRLIGLEDGPAGPVIVTTRVAGSAPGSNLPALASGMARALARIHALEATADTVLGHGDFWTGNALWEGDVLTGVVDWSGARTGPRGLDVAWCRQDLVLLGSRAAADAFLAEYEQRAGTQVDVAVWDRRAVQRADPNVESWAVNYAGIGRPDLTGSELRRRFDAWVAQLRS